MDDEIKFTATVRSLGHSLAITIPKRLAEKIGLKAGDIVAVKVKKADI